MPGDIIVADDDGATVVPAQLASRTNRKGQAHAEWEDFSRMKLAEGGTCASTTRSAKKPALNTKLGAPNRGNSP